MFKKSVLFGLLLAAGVSLLSACSSVGSTGPQMNAQGGHAVKSMCVTPQLPVCQK